MPRMAIRLGAEDTRRKAAEDEATAKRLKAIEKARTVAKKQQDARVKEFIHS